MKGMILSQLVIGSCIRRAKIDTFEFCNIRIDPESNSDETSGMFRSIRCKFAQNHYLNGSVFEVSSVRGILILPSNNLVRILFCEESGS
jgi:hypothetical protein